MSKRIIIAFLLSTLIFSLNTFSQTKINQKKFVGKNFWTKFILPTQSDCKIEIRPNDISPSEKFCSFNLHLKADTEIKIKKLSDEKEWARLTFEVNDEEFEIFIRNDSQTSFRKSFDSAFSRKKISEDEIFPDCNFKNKVELIRRVGFPSEISRTGAREKWTFNAGYIHFSFCGYDVTYVEIKNNKITGISGLI